MKVNRAENAEKGFDRVSWLVFGGVAGFLLLILAGTLAILMLPTDGWQIPYNTSPPPLLDHFAGDWATPLQAGDRVLAIDGAAFREGSTFRPRFGPVSAWQAGQIKSYTVLRDGRQIQVPVILHHLDPQGLLRSLWSTMSVDPTEWSWSILACLVFFLKPRNHAARLMFIAFVPHNAVVKLAWAANTISQNVAPAPVFYFDEFINSFWGFLFFPSLILLALSFPRPIFPASRWPRAVPLFLFGLPALLTMIIIILNSDLLMSIVLVSEAVLIILAFGLALINARSLAHDPVARVQLLWLIFGFILTIVPTYLAWLLSYAGILNLMTINWFYQYLIVLALPACLTIAITRYHLFDIYIIVRRTLQYSLLTVFLGLFYLGMVVLMQTVFSSLTGVGSGPEVVRGGGRPSELAIAVSTLAIAALFHPVRRYVQNFIDRRFFRSHYNADLILTSFTGAARKEVGLQPLTGALLSVVDETFQPEKISLWLKPTAPDS